ncbi:MAG: hypothetical protein JXR42_00605 [Gammaproteobacteria bacterium]|nr:hypothetical protein [Gammaproteobacteria bacterium]
MQNSIAKFLDEFDKFFDDLDDASGANKVDPAVEKMLQNMRDLTNFIEKKDDSSSENQQKFLQKIEKKLEKIQRDLKSSYQSGFGSADTSRLKGELVKLKKALDKAGIKSPLANKLTKKIVSLFALIKKTAIPTSIIRKRYGGSSPITTQQASIKIRQSRPYYRYEYDQITQRQKTIPIFYDNYDVVITI